MWEKGEIERPLGPVLPDLTLRGFGNFSIGERTADAVQRDEKRKQMRERTMADVATRPEKCSAVVPFTDVAAELIDQKIEARWYVPDDDAPGGRHLHCFEGTIKEIIPYSATRANYPEFRLCKHPVALVQWDVEFGYRDSHVPLNPNKYEQELEYMGWNVLNAEFVEAQRAIARADAQDEEDLRADVAMAHAVLDIGMGAADCGDGNCA